MVKSTDKLRTHFHASLEEAYRKENITKNDEQRDREREKRKSWIPEKPIKTLSRMGASVQILDLPE